MENVSKNEENGENLKTFVILPRIEVVDIRNFNNYLEFEAIEKVLDLKSYNETERN